MNHSDYAQHIRSVLPTAPTTLPAFEIDDQRRNNAARCMTLLVCHRLSQGGERPRRIRHKTFEWQHGSFALRNSRVADHHWSTAQKTVVDKLHELAQQQPVVYLLTHWDVEAGMLHAWAVPEDVAFAAFAKLPLLLRGDSRTVRIGLDDHLLKNAPDMPSFADYYVRAELPAVERAKLLEAIKTDYNIVQQRSNSADEACDLDDESEDEPVPGYTQDTVAFLQKLPRHIEDAAWHEQNKRRYERDLRDPTRALVEDLKTRYIQRLNPAVARGKRHLSILKKNDYGKGGYHDHYWFAFYDPEAGSKTRSVQLFAIFLGSQRLWRYGLSMGNYCDDYIDRLLVAISNARDAVGDYLRHAPDDTFVQVISGESTQRFTPAEFAERLVDFEGRESASPSSRVTSFEIGREFELSTLPEHSESLVEEIGEYFVWVWPFFDAAVSGVWQGPCRTPAAKRAEDEVEPDEGPTTIGELAEITALPERFLTDLEEALRAKQQVILSGPPGTSKTFIARQFARYFVRQRTNQPQGNYDVLYMHANWGYEDFFEGVKLIPEHGSLKFESRPGFFIKWVDGLKDYSPQSRHVLVLDEINRCDTAAVLGELLQLLEYPDMTVPLLSGRRFVFPSNLFIIGTMNSADRSIGRMDLALQRRFFWVDLHCQSETLTRWLERPGNNPIGFDAASLVRCNELLAERGISSEQQIGHALFMLQRTAQDDEASPSLDIPLSEKQLRQIVRFSVLPYVRELLTMQTGQVDSDLLWQISGILLDCVGSRPVPSSFEPSDDPLSS